MISAALSSDISHTQSRLTGEVVIVDADFSTDQGLVVLCAYPTFVQTTGEGVIAHCLAIISAQTDPAIERLVHLAHTAPDVSTMYQLVF